MNNKINTHAQGTARRCAIYKRSATQDLASLINQERVCRDAAASMEMIVEDQFVVSEAGTSGNAESRDGLNWLLAAAGKCPRPFDYVVFADTSRLGRNLAVVLHVFQALKNHGVNMYFVDQKLDSHDNNFELLLVNLGQIDTPYVKRRGEAVSR